MWLLDRLLRRAMKVGALEIRDASGHVHRYGEADAPPVKLRLTNSRIAWRLARSPALATGEAFMNGELIVESGDIVDLIDLIGRNMRWDRENPTRLALWNSQRLAARWEELNPRKRARQNVHHHYDLSDRLYEMFLDSQRQYSCAYFRDGNQGPDSDLEQAQQDKLVHIARKLRLAPGQKVLDIGCGWGGMARHIHATSGADVLGITLSDEQLKYARAKARELGIDDHVRYELMDYRDVKGSFDRIVSVGMFEHVGRPNYTTFFDEVARILKPDGSALIHFIGRVGGKGTTDPWTAKYIFPGGYTPALSEVLPHMERAWLWPTDIEVWRLHYAWTLEHWLKRCRAHRDEIVALYDERFFRMWEFYLAGARNAFLFDDHVVYQIQLARHRDGVPLTRDYLCDHRGEDVPETPATDS